jgi:hypothetical protein
MIRIENHASFPIYAVAARKIRGRYLNSTLDTAMWIKPNKADKVLPPPKTPTVRALTTLFCRESVSHNPDEVLVKRCRPTIKEYKVGGEDITLFISFDIEGLPLESLIFCFGCKSEKAVSKCLFVTSIERAICWSCQDTDQYKTAEPA